MSEDRRPGGLDPHSDRYGEGADRWILVLDIGTSSVRAWLYDDHARGVDPGPAAQRHYAWDMDPPGTMECDADALVARVSEAIDGALLHARAAGLSIAAVGVATFWHSILGLRGGRPATPVYGWGDTRAREEALRLRDRVDESALHARTGCFLHPSYPSVKLSWLRGQDPSGFGAVESWVSFPEYLEGVLFGQRRCSLSMASGSGLLDVHRLRWDPEALDLAGVDQRQLSPLVDTDAPLRGLPPHLARRWPELAEVPWYAALGDGACANAGSGAVGVDRLGVTVGTSAAVRMLWEPRGPVAVPDELWCYRLDARRWVAGGALSNGGNTIAHLRDLLDLPEEREWEARVAAMEPDAHGLTVLPFLVAERGPGWLAETRSLVLGATAATGAEEMLRAWMEAVAYRIGRVHQRLRDAAGGGEVFASGGALHASPIWGQILADVLHRPVSLTVEPEATSRGAALVVLERLGWIADLLDRPSTVAVRFQPDPARHARYRAAATRQQALLDALAGWQPPAAAPPVRGEPELDT